VKKEPNSKKDIPWELIVLSTNFLPNVAERGDVGENQIRVTVLMKNKVKKKGSEGGRRLREKDRVVRQASFERKAPRPDLLMKYRNRINHIVLWKGGNGR